MSRFHPLAVARVERETRDAITVTFDVPVPLRDLFRFAPGQHLTLRADVAGAELRRSYSICAAVGEPLRIAVKRASDGVFSSWANKALRAGMTLDVMPPLGHFSLPAANLAELAHDASAARVDASAHPVRRHYLAVAAGSGITPVLSILATTLAADANARFTLIYGNRASSTVMFRDELAALKDLHLDRLNLVHVLSREAQDIELLHGRIDRAKADALFASWVQIDDIDAAFVCGPEAMMDSVRESLQARGVPPGRIRIERFASSVPVHAHVPRPVADKARSGCEVTVTIDGSVRSFVLAKGRENLIDGALRNGIDLPFSCKSGVCSTCRCKLVDGEVDMDANFALEDYEVARGFILACQSYAVTDRVSVDFDQTGSG